ncbi:hypothetical protein PENSPDRAFT_363304 [Peniophora sp. CONT]|nr:hypothetical protein PENSPDRAFT_363304 [Peniophora sp. CONT]
MSPEPWPLPYAMANQTENGPRGAHFSTLSRDGGRIFNFNPSSQPPLLPAASSSSTQSSNKRSSSASGLSGYAMRKFRRNNAGGRETPTPDEDGAPDAEGGEPDGASTIETLQGSTLGLIEAVTLMGDHAEHINELTQLCNGVIDFARELVLSASPDSDSEGLEFDNAADAIDFIREHINRVTHERDEARAEVEQGRTKLAEANDKVKDRDATIEENVTALEKAQHDTLAEKALQLALVATSEESIGSLQKELRDARLAGAAPGAASRSQAL